MDTLHAVVTAFAEFADSDDHHGPVPHLSHIAHGITSATLLLRLQGKERLSYAQSLCAFFVLAIGGTTICSLLLGNAPVFFIDDHIVSLYIVIHFISLRMGSLFERAESSPLAALALHFFSDISTAVAITRLGADAAGSHRNKHVRESFFASLLCGFLSGCGGTLVAEATGIASKPHLSFPRSLAKFSPQLRKVLAMSFLYTLFSRTTFVSPYLPSVAGIREHVITTFVAIGVLEHMTAFTGAGGHAGHGDTAAKPTRRTPRREAKRSAITSQSPRRNKRA